VIYTAITGVLNGPNDDRFMVITEHDQADLVISPEGSQSGSHRREIPSDIGRHCRTIHAGKRHTRPT
jgi:hypothetical protein